MSEKWKPYPAYKDSGVAWLGEIPAHWKVQRSDGFLRENRHMLSPQKLPSSRVFHYSIPALEQTGDGQIEENSEIESMKLLLNGGELLVSKLNPRKTRVLIAEPHPEPTICSSEFVVMEPVGCVAEFAFYLYSSEEVRQYLSARVESATRSHQRVAGEIIAKLWCALPSPAEQRAIAAFLDRETAKIDALIAKKERLIELLQEKRAALISHAVTKGLNPKAPMKNSGVEWLGEVSAHWEVKRLKFIARFMYGDSLAAESREEGEVPVFGSNGIVGSHKIANTLAPALIIGRKGSYGKVNFSSQPCFAIDTTFFIDTTSTNTNLRWLYYALSLLNLDMQSQDSAVPGLSREFAYEQWLPSISDLEQRAIAAYLDFETGKIDALIAKVQGAIERMREYRTALISAAVTGKMDVRATA